MLLYLEIMLWEPVIVVWRSSVVACSYSMHTCMHMHPDMHTTYACTHTHIFTLFTEKKGLEQSYKITSPGLALESALFQSLMCITGLQGNC